MTLATLAGGPQRRFRRPEPCAVSAFLRPVSGTTKGVSRPSRDTPFVLVRTQAVTVGTTATTSSSISLWSWS